MTSLDDTLRATTRTPEHPVGGGPNPDSRHPPGHHRLHPRPPRPNSHSRVDRGVRVASSKWWRAINRRAGYVVFGLPAAFAIPALITTWVQFGLWRALIGAGPLFVWVIAPLLLWIRYTRHPPQTRAGSTAWGILAAAVTVSLLISPVFFWTGPVLVLLISELLRATCARTSRPRATSIPESP